ncbi:conjugative relaxase domain-containing protein, TrwC/TraI family [Bryocella elongata]|uniref:Conjugative relaxase domain-containing protein, TrwC/TraI family n=1 Tax=Bryocella elongata TaxID=863522 RepID=A0A1H6CEA0_9BACT|nr:MobF family relaxase [Bryocella elongata]SEG71153.1 conjugative relaxase domain-containing protein, TrwC/TraI family [Bryocella elongata]
MLDISKPLNAAQAQNYHKLDYTSPTQSYYAQGDAVKGEWQGKLAESMGVSGEVSALEFSRLTEGQHPMTGEQMVRHRIATEYANPDGSTTKAVAHRAGWDAMFAPAKSVSLTALVGGDDRIRVAHREAVTTALEELEKYTHARLGGNKPAEQTGKFLVAKFEHDTARPVDGYAAPQLHTHAVIFNVTQRADGTTRALQEQPFFESQNFITAVYQSELMFRLRSIGYEIEPGESGAPEIKGFSTDYLKASSLRREKIKEEMERRGVSGPEAAEIAARSTREKKHTLTPAEVLAAHREVAAEYGNQPQRVVAEARQRAQAQQHNPDRVAHAREAVTYARSSLFEREAVSDERLLLRDSLRRGMGETTYTQVRAEFEARQQRGDFLHVDGHKYASSRSFTTPETIAAERANIAQVQAGKNTVQSIMSAEQAQQQARSQEFLNDSQRRVIEEVLNSTDRIQGLQGRAGTGKTSVLRSIREGAEKSGLIVEGFAPTSRAAGQLREVGIEASTFQSFLARRTDGAAPETAVRHLYMLDESSLASTRQMRDFFQKLTPNDRVLVVGDTAQHQGVDAGRPFQQMQEAGMRTAQLDRIMRQRDPELLKAVEHLSKSETREGITLLHEQGRITEVSNRQERIAAIAKDYAARPENTIVVSPDNKSRQEINEAIRSELRQMGKLQNDGQSFRTLSHRSDMTGADRTWAARYNVGDVLQYNTGSKELGIERDSFARVQAVDAKANLLTVQRSDGETVAYDPRRLRGVNVFREQEREFATNDRLQFVAPLKELGVANRDLGTVQSIQNSRMTVLMDGKDKRVVSFDTASVRVFDHGYAVTSHSSQGLTAGRVLAHFDTEGPRALINRRLAYVAISRASEDARIYTNNAATLGKRLATDISKTAAIDLHESNVPAGIQRVVSSFRDNEPAMATAILQQDGKVHEYASSEHRIAAVALAYAAQQDRSIVFAPDPDERHELTTLIRDELRQRGLLAPENHVLPVLIERQLGNPRLAANYQSGDEIHYKAGSPVDHGIADHSISTVLTVDAKSNLLTVATRDGSEVIYNPALLRKQTDQARVFRSEEREIANGERIRITASMRELHVRAGDFATVEAVGDDHSVSVRHDSGRMLALSEEQAPHIEYGYTAGRIPQSFSGRVFATGEAQSLAQHAQDFARLSGQTRDLVLYTSEGGRFSREQSIAADAIGQTVSMPGLPSGDRASVELSVEQFGKGR